MKLLQILTHILFALPLPTERVGKRLLRCWGSLLLLFPLALSAQTNISGIVVDSLSQRPIANANVLLMSNGKTITFVRTNEKGEFVFHNVSSEPSKLQLQATAMEYARKKIAVKKASGNRIEMAQKVFEMKEITVMGGPITARRDTITFDLTRFTSERDNNLKDVLKKLPGVQVADNGKISVQGKEISRFTVEGLDLSDGSYNKLTDNIKAKDVKKAEVIEHDQPIKALQDKVFTDNIAMNVVLKDSVRDQLSLTLRPYLAVGRPTHVGGSANAMQIGKRKQVMYDIIYDRTGKDISNSNQQFVFDFMAPQPASLSAWYSVAGLVAPIDANRLRFNTSQNYSINRLTKLKNDSELRITADYYRNVLRQNRTNFSTYYLAETPTITTENHRLTLLEDVFNFNIDKKINMETHYGTIRFKMDAAQEDALSELESTGHANLSQRVRTPELNLQGYISTTTNHENSTFSWQSIVDYHHSRNDLYLNDDHEKINSNLWHTDNEASWRIGNRLKQNYNIGIEAEHLNVRGGNTDISLYSSPNFNYKSGKWRTYFGASLRLKYLTQQQKAYFTASPYVGTNFKKSSRTEYNASLSYGESIRGLATFALDNYRTDYRTWNVAPTFMPWNRSFNFNFRHAYKRVVRELFANTTFKVSRSWSNSVVDMQILNGNYLMKYAQHNTCNTNIIGSYWLSKGFYKYHLKTSLSLSAMYNKGEQYTNDRVVGYNYRSLSLAPSITYSPSFMFLSYEGTFTIGKSKTDNIEMASRFNWRQSLTLTATIHHVDLSVKGTYHHNQLEAGALNTFLADASAIWRLKKVLFSAKLTNIFNRCNYEETTYTGVGIFTNRYELRPRTFILGVEIRL